MGLLPCVHMHIRHEAPCQTQIQLPINLFYGYITFPHSSNNGIQALPIGATKSMGKFVFFFAIIVKLHNIS